MSHGDSLDEIAAENPDLPREAFAAAVLFTKAHPLPDGAHMAAWARGNLMDAWSTTISI
ncbi:hypothetical protein IYX23_05180 [Methylocystis sp. L43]|uniref:hypothetical protein n=1 Tax=Methylocystis TaxID=133 RepID=UPI0012B3ECEC|nr:MULTISPECIES: hypothetical protein [Methylocystis]MBG0797079.1 hypothetical protein [Methylocystis sp. L43]MBG0804925.1 hypothetical protein [Methylocystis sp. H15]